MLVTECWIGITTISKAEDTSQRIAVGSIKIDSRESGEAIVTIDADNQYGIEMGDVTDTIYFDISYDRTFALFTINQG